MVTFTTLTDLGHSRLYFSRENPLHGFWRLEGSFSLDLRARGDDALDRHRRMMELRPWLYHAATVLDECAFISGTHP